MNHTRTGKIARLPKVVREVLGDRLEQGHPAADLVNWLNGLECVQESLAEHFGGRPINEQNLSEWRAGGHQDWLRHEEVRRQVAQLAERGDDLTEAARGQELSDRLARHLVVEVMRLAETLLEQETDPVQSWARLREINQELSRLRRDDQQTSRLRLLERRVVLAEDAPAADLWNRRGREEKERRSSPLHSRLVLNDLERDAKASGKKKWWQKFEAEDAAIAAAGQTVTTLNSPLPAGHPETPGASPKAISPDPGPQAPDLNSAPKPGQIKPNQAKSNPRTKKSAPAPGARLSQPQHMDMLAASDHQPSSDHQSVPLSAISVNGGAGQGEEALNKNAPSPSQARTASAPSVQNPPLTPDARPQTPPPQSNLSARVETTCPPSLQTLICRPMTNPHPTANPSPSPPFR